MSSRIVLVTGANSGIGFALSKQLIGKDYGCRVLLGSRSADKGKAAVENILKEAPEAKIESVTIDVGDDKSVLQAAKDVEKLLGGETLYAIVNNAGTGLAHGSDIPTIINTNFYGPKRVIDAFAPMLKRKGRIVNVGSGSGPMFVDRLGQAGDASGVALLTGWDTSFDSLDSFVRDQVKKLKPDSKDDTYTAYGLSKAALTNYTMGLAKQLHGAKVETRANCLSPGFIATAIVSGFGAKKPAEEGTVSLHHCLFGKVGNGFYYGSDAIRSPLTKIRNPGEPEYKPSDDKYQ